MVKRFLTYNELNEALKLSQYREYHGIRPKDIENKLSELFKGKNRIYIPFEYTIIDETIEPDRDISFFLSTAGYKITDYLGGYCEKDGRTFRIGKILKKLGYEKLLKKFNEDPQRAIKIEKFLICISKHPYDIAGMSTDRGWTSCMNLEGESENENAIYIYDEIENGSLIAYLINVEDKNINHPYGRVTIKPYTNETGEMGWKPSYKCYGSMLEDIRDFSEKFLKEIEEWIDVNLNLGPDGFYKGNRKVYSNESHPDFYKTEDVRIKELYTKGINFESLNLEKNIYKGAIIIKKDVREFKGFENYANVKINRVSYALIFTECISLTYVSNLPEYVGHNLSFYNCYSLTSVSNLPKNIGRDLIFRNCKSLKSITDMPEIITGDLDFVDCTSLENISNFPKYVLGSIKVWNCPFFPNNLSEYEIREKYNINT